MVLGDGGFLYSDPSPGALRQANSAFLIRAPGFLDHHVFFSKEQLKRLTSGRRIDPLRIELVPPATVEGRVMGSRGEPAAGAEVVLTVDPSKRYPRALWKATTGPDGSFRIAGVDPRSKIHLVAYRLEGEVEQRSTARRVLIEPGHGATAWHEIVLHLTEEVELTVAIHDFKEGMKVVVEGEEHRPTEAVVTTRARTGPNRVTLKDLTCRTIGERAVEVPEGYRSFRTDLSGDEE